MKNLLLLLLTVSSCIHLPCSADEEKGTYEASKKVVEKAGSTKAPKKTIKKTKKHKKTQSYTKKKNLLKSAKSSWNQYYKLIKANPVATTMLAGFTITIFGVLRYAPLQERIIFQGKPISDIDDAAETISDEKSRAKQVLARFKYGNVLDTLDQDIEVINQDIDVKNKQYETELIPGKTIKLFGRHYKFKTNRNDNKNKKVILMFHGNAGNAFTRHSLGLQLISITGYDVFIASYPGYGINEGKIRYEEDFYKATEAAYNYLRKAQKDGGLGYQEKNTILLSCSIGGSAIINIASKDEYNPSCLALVAPFTSVPDFRWWLKPFLYPIIRYPLHNLSKITKVRCSILIAHDTEDPVIPHSHSKKLVNAIQEKNKKRKPVTVEFIKEYKGGHCIDTSFIKKLTTL